MENTKRNVFVSAVIAAVFAVAIVPTSVQGRGVQEIEKSTQAKIDQLSKKLTQMQNQAKTGKGETAVNTKEITTLENKIIKLQEFVKTLAPNKKNVALKKNVDPKNKSMKTAPLNTACTQVEFNDEDVI
ncbi:hypothetical protein KKA53_03880 [Candidatus Dependentiae bacterium]|nr:hypothetical protein [Candidatus Dependentiae bacterium]